MPENGRTLKERKALRRVAGDVLHQTLYTTTLHLPHSPKPGLKEDRGPTIRRHHHHHLHQLHNRRPIQKDANGGWSSHLLRYQKHNLSEQHNRKGPRADHNHHHASSHSSCFPLVFSCFSRGVCFWRVPLFPLFMCPPLHHGVVFDLRFPLHFSRDVFDADRMPSPPPFPCKPQKHTQKSESVGDCQRNFRVFV